MVVLLNTITYQKEPWLIGERVDSKFWARIEQDELITSFLLESKENA